MVCPGYDNPSLGATVATMPNDVRDVPIRDDSIRLGQFLKLADLIDTGADAKAAIADGLVQVNGAVETRRGRQLRAGDTVSIGPNAARVGGGRSTG
jgi:ribosome-associated protein